MTIQSNRPAKSQMDPHRVEELGEQTERDMDARAGARAMGLDDLTSPGYDDMSDLNQGASRGSGSVDSLSGSLPGGDASEISEFDTITDSNTLVSPSIISGAFLSGDPFSANPEYKTSQALFDESHESDFDETAELDDDELQLTEDEIALSDEFDDDDVEENLQASAPVSRSGVVSLHDELGELENLSAQLETDSTTSGFDATLGMRDESDDETVQKYIDANREEQAARGERPSRSRSDEHSRSA